MLRAPGRPLEPRSRAIFEEGLGHDFGNVRVHLDSQATETAQALGAAAYTVGRHVVFGPGRYTPETVPGLRLLGHELAHVVQQRHGDPGAATLGPDSPASEREAERASLDALGGRRHPPSSRSPVRLARRIPIPDDLDPEQRRQAEEYLAEAEERRRHPASYPDAGQATFDGHRLTVTKGGASHSCEAFTSGSAPTPSGRFCVRRQGEAQRWGGLMGTAGRALGLFTTARQDRSRWYLLEPQFTTTRSKMQIHYGRRSEGCITLGSDDCFDAVSAVLNREGIATGNGYDGYPPGNADGVNNPLHAVDCVAWLTVT